MAKSPATRRDKSAFLLPHLQLFHFCRYMEPYTTEELFMNGARGYFSPLYRLPQTNPVAFGATSNATPPATTAPALRQSAQVEFAQIMGQERQLPLYAAPVADAGEQRRGDAINARTGESIRAAKGAGRRARTKPDTLTVIRHKGIPVVVKAVDLEDGGGGWEDIDPRLVRAAGHGVMEPGTWEESDDEIDEFFGAVGLREKCKEMADSDDSFYESQEIIFRQMPPETHTPKPPRAPVAQAWVTHNTPLLEDYAQRQICPPLGDRVNVNLNDPSQFVAGMLQMLACRDPITDKENVDPSRGLPPQLLDAFVDVHRWAKEYFRAQFGQATVADNVPVLLTILTNNFYEAHMHLIDTIVQQAMGNMKARRGSSLEVEDFAFGFDLHMSQEMPFFVEANHRVRDTLEAHRPKSPVSLPPQPTVTRYGRESKMTEHAKAATLAQQDKLNKARKKARTAANQEPSVPTRGQKRPRKQSRTTAEHPSISTWVPSTAADASPTPNTAGTTGARAYPDASVSHPGAEVQVSGGQFTNVIPPIRIPPLNHRPAEEEPASAPGPSSQPGMPTSTISLPGGLDALPKVEATPVVSAPARGIGRQRRRGARGRRGTRARGRAA